ncbi:MAG: hypothetical protein IKV88_03935 [Clostridia bacterium]|nr:hypothetical protein [Clostridia bacterium]
MNKTYKMFIYCALGAYTVKFLVDIIMLIYSIYGLNDYYYDDYYLFIPHMVATFLVSVYYIMFFKEEFYGLMIKLFTIILLLVQVGFIILLVYDRTLGYVFYFSGVAALNFFDALFVKCNIIPLRDAGDFEYGPMVFEMTSFVIMAVSIYAFFAAFPISFNHLVGYWEYYDVSASMKLNMICEFIMILIFFACLRNNCKYIRDIVIDEDSMMEEIQ